MAEQDRQQDVQRQDEQHQQGENITDRQQKDDSMKRQILTAGIVIVSACCIILFYFGVQRYAGLHKAWSSFVGILQPIIIGFAMAFLMNPIMQFLERRLYPFLKRHSKSVTAAKKTARLICSLAALIIFLGMIVLMFVAIIPETVDTARYLVDNLGDKIGGVLDWANQITGGHFEENIMHVKESGIEESLQKGLEWLGNFLEFGQDEIVSMVTSGVISVGRLFVNLIVGIIVSIYILMSKEVFKGQGKKLIYGIFKTEHANVILEIGRKTADIFYGFIIGKIIDSIIIGIICYIGMVIFRFPYALLVSVIVGVTNVIPVFGPYIGAVPTVIIIFLTNPMQGIYFLIFIFALQQADGNIIGPKILGDSTGLSSFWVVLSIVVGGGLFGFMGMLLGVPTMALIYYLAGRFSKYLLRRKGLPEETDTYVHLKEVNLVTNRVVPKTLEEEEKSHFHFLAGTGKKKNRKESTAGKNSVGKK